jgi:hypothetical protein
VGREDDRVALERLAVGDHILLGGDNIDVALARLLEPRLGEKLDSQRWQALTNLCRAAKETLLGPAAPADVPIRLAGRGRSIVGGTVSATLTRSEVEPLVLDGFFPLTPADALPRKTPRAGLQEWGLPFAAEPEVSRHLAAFLKQQAGEQFPDAVLFNGGALTPPLIRDRLCALLASWNGDRRPTVLESTSLDLSVSRGAAYYGLVRRGLGVRIGGGSARAYFLGLAGRDATASSPTVDVLCLVQRGMHEGTELEITTPEFSVLANQPVSFPLYASSTRLGDQAGAVIQAERDSLSALPAIRTVLRFGKKLAATALPVHLIGKLTEVGTLEVWCRSLTTDHRWRLQFNLRDQAAAGDEEPAPESGGELAVSAERLSAANDALRAVFPGEGVASGDPITLMRTLEAALDAGKDAWPLTAIRALWETLFAGQAARATSQAHEARWLNLCGFLLRPGFGHALDDWRMQQLWKLYSQGLRFPRATQCRVEWWGLWKRVAGGLSRPQQTELFNQTAPYLLPRLKARKDRRSDIGPQEVREYWQLLASCEQLAPATKVELGAALLPLVVKGKASEAEIWALGRLGAEVAQVMREADHVAHLVERANDLGLLAADTPLHGGERRLLESGADRGARLGRERARRPEHFERKLVEQSGPRQARRGLGRRLREIQRRRRGGQCLLNGAVQVVEVEGLEEIVHGPERERLLGAARVLLLGHDEQPHLHVDRPDAPEDLDSIGLGQAQADEDDFGAHPVELSQRLVEVVGASDHDPLAAEVLGEQLDRGGLVVHDEDGPACVSHWLGAAGASPPARAPPRPSSLRSTPPPASDLLDVD